MDPTSESPFLSKQEIADLTDRVQRAAQVKVLRFMGIEHRQRPDGTLVVLREHVRNTLGASPRTRSTPTVQPNWDAI